MMIIDVPVASYSQPSKIRAWIAELELAREDQDAEPFDLVRIEQYLVRTRGWLARGEQQASLESGNAA
ncbi:MAG TPA: hypothetical protein VF584_16310 [Longimicrobium sp.]|jgi:hypothetical protein